MKIECEFAFRLSRSVWRHPLLVGWAHDFQRVDTIAGAAWDVPLDYVVTDHGVYSR
jgi:5-formyltetrahydrofolate cyclo-ligase